MDIFECCLIGREEGELVAVAPLALQERIFHPTYMRVLCLHVRRRGVSLADALAGTGMTWRQLLHEKRGLHLRARHSPRPLASGP